MPSLAPTHLLLGLVRAGPFDPDDDRLPHIILPNSINHSISHNVRLCDPSKSVHEDRLHIRVSIERLNRQSRIDPVRSTTSVEEVGWGTTGDGQPVHCAHCVASAVAEGADVSAIGELDVEETAVFGLRRVGVTGPSLVQILQGGRQSM